jgi:sulfide:quinone oxidoreductase
VKIVVAGALFGVLEVATPLSAAFDIQVDVTLIDRGDGSVFGYSKLDAMFGRALPETIRLPYRTIAKPGVAFRQETVTAIDPVARRVVTDRATCDPDILVLAPAADYDVDALARLPRGPRPARPHADRSGDAHAVTPPRVEGGR